MNGAVLVFVLASLHVGYTTPQQGLNPGVGLLVPFHPHTTLEVGAYRNSRDGLSLYETVRFHTEGHINIGLHVGVVTGYDWPVLPLVFPSIEVGTSRVRVRVDVLPVRHPVLGFQLLVGH